MKKHVLLALLLLPFLAQAQVGTYRFASQSGAFTPLASGTDLGDAANDDAAFNDNPIGFSFSYAGTDYTNFSVNTNGFIEMGPTVNDLGSGVAIVNGADHSGIALGNPVEDNNLIAGFNMDLVAADGSTLRYATLGASPNQVLVVEWSKYHIYNQLVPTEDSLTFQIRLYEAGSKVEVVYGTMIYTLTGAFTAQVGLRGAAVSDFNNRTTTSSWTASARGTAATDNMMVSPTVFPPSGLTYAWTPDLNARDIAASRIDIPAANGCGLGASQPLTAHISNPGPTSIDSIVGSYSVNNAAPVQQLFILATPLAPGDSTTITFTTPISTGTNGRYQIVADLSAFGEDSGTLGNGRVSAEFQSIASITAVPYQEAFTSATDLPDGWMIRHEAGQGDWVLAGPDIYPGSALGSTVSTVQGDGALFFNSYRTAFQGGVSLALSPCFDLASAPGDSLFLQVSYLQTSDYPAALDSIGLRATLNNGTSFYGLGNLLSYNADVTAGDAVWSLAVINVTALKSSSGVRFVLAAGGDNGDNLAVDYVSVTATRPVVANKPVIGSSISLYPNPTAGLISLRNLPANLVGTSTDLTDLAGRVVATRRLQPQMDLRDLPPGVYALQAGTARVKVVVSR